MEIDPKSVITVEGPIDPKTLGTTLAHEHIFIDQVTSWFEEPRTPRDQRLSKEPISIENLSYVRSHKLAHRDNMRLDSTETAIEELERYRRAGGDSIVDLTTKGIGADPIEIQKIARGSNLNIIHGTAFYTEAAHPQRIKRADQSEIRQEFVSDVEEGIDDTDVRAGIIGEIGLSETISSQEEKVLRAGARAALRTGTSLNIHPPLFGPNQTPRAALDALDIVEEAGLPLNRVIVSHMDQDHQAMSDLEDHRTIADRGAFIEFDQWYIWQGWVTAVKKEYPSDSTRVDALFELIDDGYLDQILLGHDVSTKLHLQKYGGMGYVFFHDILKPWLHQRGLDQNKWVRLMEGNPREVLTLVEPE